MRRINTPIQVRFNDIDMAGHVHNAVYFYYFEIGRIHFFDHVSGNDWNWKEKGFLVARNEADYLKPVHLTDKIFVETTCEQVGNKSITLSYNLYCEKEDSIKELYAKGRSILVCMDFKTNKSVEVFTEWKEMLEVV